MTTPILNLANEVIIEVFSSLPSIHEVLALSATCHEFHDLWVTHAAYISERGFASDAYARKQALKFFLAHAGEDDHKFSRYARTIQVVKNYVTVEKAMNVFENETVPKVVRELKSSDPLI